MVSIDQYRSAIGCFAGGKAAVREKYREEEKEER